MIWNQHYHIINQRAGVHTSESYGLLPNAMEFLNTHHQVEFVGSVHEGCVEYLDDMECHVVHSNAVPTSSIYDSALTNGLSAYETMCAYGESIKTCDQNKNNGYHRKGFRGGSDRGVLPRQLQDDSSSSGSFVSGEIDGVITDEAAAYVAKVYSDFHKITL